MKDILKIIENLPFWEDIPNPVVDWWDELALFFSPRNIDDITDIDRPACFSYLVSLNQNNEGLSSPALDSLLKKDDAYFAEVVVSRDKPLTAMYFWKYPKGSKGHILHTSKKPFLKDQINFYKSFKTFAVEYNLLLLRDKDLRRRVMAEGRPARLYFKYFDQTSPDPLYLPYNKP